MTAPDKIWIAGPASECGHYYPNATEAEGEHGGQAVEYTRSDLIAARAVKSLGTLAMNDEGGLYLTDQPDNSLVAVAVRDVDMPWRRAHPDVIDAIVERFNAPALRPASPLGAVTITDEMVNRAIEAFDACDALPTDEGDFDAMKAALAAALAPFARKGE